jgi:hypothetical protein
MPLSPEQIQELLKPKERVTESRTPQVGPLRWFDKEMRCANRNCGSSTFCKVQGIPRCMMHSLHELNSMLVEAGFDGTV